MAERKIVISKAYVIFLGFCVLSLFIVGKIAMIQLVEGAKWQKKVDRITTELHEITPSRGNIFAENGTILATSIPIYDLRMDMKASKLTREMFNKHIDALSDSLSQLFGDKPASVYERNLRDAFAKGSRYYLVKGGIEFDQMQLAKNLPLWSEGRFTGGLIIEKTIIRKVPYPNLAARTVGYDKEGTQRVGLEGAYNDVLGGKPGKRYEKRLAGGIWMPVNSSNLIDPEDGCDLYTTIDVGIQDVATNALKKQLIKRNAQYGCAVVMEVKTGRIKAIANLTLTKDSTYREVYNYAIGEASEPGSTFKLASLMAALEDGLLSLDDSVDTGNGTYKFYDKMMYDSERDKGGYGRISALTGFQKSSNVAVSRLIDDRYRKNPRAFTDRLYKMGLGRSLGIDIGGEGEPMIKDPSDPTWSGVSLPWMSIGYETKMTPLQTLTFYNAVANDGEMVKPQFVKEIRRNGKLVKKIKPEVLHHSIASRETIRKAKIMLESVVTEEGTAANLITDSYTVAGKTGTALMANNKHGYKSQSSKKYQASFVGYFPAEAPEYTCIVMVYGLKSFVYYGGAVAGPVFREIADKIYVDRLDLHKPVEQDPNSVAIHVPVSKSGYGPDLKYIFEVFDISLTDHSDDADWVSTKTLTDEVGIEARTIPSGKVPNVVGMGLRDGIYLLESAGLRVQVSGVGMITKQSIPPGSHATEGRTIIIDLS
jgi:cell division protein FtsI (penicillin-binding protein 3)